MAAFIPIFVANNARRIAAANAQAQADAYRRLQEGEHAPPQPKVRGVVSKAIWRFVKIAIASCTTVMGIKMLVSLFVSRFVHQDPTLQDPVMMIGRAIAALIIMGAGYIPILADQEET